MIQIFPCPYLNALRKIIPIEAWIFSKSWVSIVLIIDLFLALDWIIQQVMYNFPVMDLLVFTNFLNWLLMIALPILLGIYLIRKFHFTARIWWIGAAIFILSQVLHLPFNNYILNPFLANLQGSLPGSLGILVAAGFLGLSAGIFEEFARYGMFRWWLKENRTWRSAILAGAGHGGAEVIILGLYVMYIYINMIALRNTDLSTLNLAPDQLSTVQQQVQQYWTTPWYNTLIPFVERVFTVPFHIMASVLVLQVFTRRPGRQQLGWLGLAIILHTLMDASAVFIASQWSVYAAEAVLGGLAVLHVIIIFALRQPEPEPPACAPSQLAVQLPKYTPAPIEETSENLEKTRYQ